MRPQASEYLAHREEGGSLGHSRGWFKAMRGDAPLELIRANPLAYALAAVIANRAQYRDGFNRHNLALGEALLGDYKNYGMSERKYRTAKQQLAKWGFATFNATSKGTVAKLTDIRLFAVLPIESDGRSDRQATTERRTGDGQATTTKNKRTQEPNNGRVPAAPISLVKGVPQ